MVGEKYEPVRGVHFVISRARALTDGIVRYWWWACPAISVVWMMPSELTSRLLSRINPSIGRQYPKAYQVN